MFHSDDMPQPFQSSDFISVMISGVKHTSGQIFTTYAPLYLTILFPEALTAL
jgi:hypothetical protein